MKSTLKPIHGRHWGQRVFAMIVVAMLLITLVPATLALQVAGANNPAGRNIDEHISIQKLEIYLNNDDNPPFYLYEDGKKPTFTADPLELTPNTLLYFRVHWLVNKDFQNSIQENDYFTLPILKLTNISGVTDTVDSLTDGDGTEVGTGTFNHDAQGKLTYTVNFSSHTNSFSIIGGSADGTAFLEANTSSGGNLIEFEDGTSLEVIEKAVPPVDPPEPYDPDPEIKKASFDQTDSTVTSIKNKFNAKQSGYGLDWRLTFFKYVAATPPSDDIIIEDTLSANQIFANFQPSSNASRDAAFKSGMAAPFAIEIPVSIIGENRVINYVGGNPNAADKNAYSNTVIRPTGFNDYTGSSSAESDVRGDDFSWAIVDAGSGQQKLIVNIGKMGANSSLGGKLSSDVVHDTYMQLVDEIVKAQKQLDGVDILNSNLRWAQVFRNDVKTIFHYWPNAKVKIAEEVNAGSTSESAIIDKLFKSSDLYGALTSSDVTNNLGSMTTDAFVMRYRSVLTDTRPSTVSNDAKVSSGSTQVTTDYSYKHKYGSEIFVKLKSGDLLVIKSDKHDLANKDVNFSSNSSIGTDDLAKIDGLSGFTFKLVDRNGTTLTFKRNEEDNDYTYDKSSTLSELTTGSDGTFIVHGLPSEKYTLEEVSGRYGYEAPSPSMPIIISSDKVNYYTFVNQSYGVKLVKICADCGNQHGLEGAVFHLFKDTEPNVPLTGFQDKGNYYIYTKGAGRTDITSKSNGVVEIRGLEPGGYLFREQKAPDHYVLNDTPIGFSVVDGSPVIVNAGTLANDHEDGKCPNPPKPKPPCGCECGGCDCDGGKCDCTCGKCCCNCNCGDRDCNCDGHCDCDKGCNCGGCNGCNCGNHGCNCDGNCNCGNGCNCGDCEPGDCDCGNHGCNCGGNCDCDKGCNCGGCNGCNCGNHGCNCDGNCNCDKGCDCGDCNGCNCGRPDCNCNGNCNCGNNCDCDDCKGNCNCTPGNCNCGNNCNCGSGCNCDQCKPCECTPGNCNCTPGDCNCKDCDCDHCKPPVDPPVDPPVNPIVPTWPWNPNPGGNGGSSGGGSSGGTDRRDTDIIRSTTTIVDDEPPLVSGVEEDMITIPDDLPPLTNKNPSTGTNPVKYVLAAALAAGSGAAMCLSSRKKRRNRKQK